LPVLPNPKPPASSPFPMGSRTSSSELAGISTTLDLRTRMPYFVAFLPMLALTGVVGAAGLADHIWTCEEIAALLD